MEGLIFGGAYLWREICPPGGLYLEGRFNGGFFALRVWGAYIWRGLYMEGLFFGILRYIFREDLAAVRIVRVSVIAGCPQGES